MSGADNQMERVFNISTQGEMSILTLKPIVNVTREGHGEANKAKHPSKQ